MLEPPQTTWPPIAWSMGNYQHHAVPAQHRASDAQWSTNSVTSSTAEGSALDPIRAKFGSNAKATVRTARVTITAHRVSVQSINAAPRSTPAVSANTSAINNATHRRPHRGSILSGFCAHRSTAAPLASPRIGRCWEPKRVTRRAPRILRGGGTDSFQTGPVALLRQVGHTWSGSDGWPGTNVPPESPAAGGNSMPHKACTVRVTPDQVP